MDVLDGAVLVNADSLIDQLPVPDVPEVVRKNPLISKMIASHPERFCVIAPIHVDQLHACLWQHPNKPFVESVYHALQECFWPWANLTCGEYPDMHDEKLKLALDDCTLQFLHDQRDKEVKLGRFSPLFGKDLLPGMYLMPVHAIPKPNPDKLHLTMNHSASPYLLNFMISKLTIAGVIMDGIPAIGHALRNFCCKHGWDIKLTMCESDVSQANCQIPMSLYWQIKQIVTIDGQCYIDQNNVFSGRGLEHAWDCLCTLINWVSKHELGIVDILNYVNDNFCFDITENC